MTAWVMKDPALLPGILLKSQSVAQVSRGDRDGRGLPCVGGRELSDRTVVLRGRRMAREVSAMKLTTFEIPSAAGPIRRIGALVDGH